MNPLLRKDKALKSNKFDIREYIKKGSKVLSGREEGKELRKKLNLSFEDLNDETLTIEIKDIYAVNPSFFLGCWGESVRNLGEEGFRRKYKFECSEILRNNIERGIRRALNDANILDV